mmetsp:Transcript_50143/g.87530  ORF Transcript_50143/g.87530 Transcript_50143/m.87530 type:complete len:216 (-) Transcript_50143:416-1063(-)
MIARVEHHRIRGPPAVKLVALAGAYTLVFGTLAVVGHSRRGGGGVGCVGGIGVDLVGRGGDGADSLATHRHLAVRTRGLHGVFGLSTPALQMRTKQSNPTGHPIPNGNLPVLYFRNLFVARGGISSFSVRIGLKILVISTFNFGVYILQDAHVHTWAAGGDEILRMGDIGRVYLLQGGHFSPAVRIGVRIQSAAVFSRTRQLHKPFRRIFWGQRR